MKLEQNIESIVKSLNLELYDISTHGADDETIFRISVVSAEMENTKHKGVTLDECVELSHLLSPVLDLNPPVSSEYRLEVGTPGIEKKISTLKQFALCIGENVAITLKTKEKLQGVLTKVEASKIYITIDSQEKCIDYSEVSKAKTYFEW